MFLSTFRVQAYIPISCCTLIICHWLTKLRCLLLFFEYSKGNTEEIGKVKGAPFPPFLNFPQHLKRFLSSSYLKIISTFSQLKVRFK